MSSQSIDLKGKVAVVTGGSRGLGREVAAALATAGASVLITGRNAATITQAAAAIAAQTGGRVIGLRADVRLPAEAASVVHEAVTILGRLDVLVNNAGVSEPAPSLEVTKAQWETVIGTNLNGTFFGSQAAARHMREQGGGVIINMSSIMGTVGAKTLAAYCAAKGGVQNLTRALAVEWAEYGIRVVGVAPAYVHTEMNAELLADEKGLNRILSKTPLRRLGTPAEVSAVVTFLASPLAGYITGETIHVDGGWTAQ